MISSATMSRGPGYVSSPATNAPSTNAAGGGNYDEPNTPPKANGGFFKRFGKSQPKKPAPQSTPASPNDAAAAAKAVNRSSGHYEDAVSRHSVAVPDPYVALFYFTT
jgi:hypothetical protein